MRIPSGTLDQVVFFVAVDSTDLKTRETGLTTFTVYRARDIGAATLMTTPTVAELSAANMPGVYSLLLDEDMTIAAGNDSEEMVFHITQAAMAPVSRTIELYRPKITLGETVTALNGAADADIERLQGSLIATPTVVGVLEVDVTHWLGTAAATPAVAGVPEVDLTHIAGALVNTTLAQLGVNVVNAAAVAWGSGAITAGVIAADAIGASELAADAVAEIADAVWDEDATGHQTLGTFGQAIGDPIADTNTIFKAVVTDAAGATVGVDVVAVQADTDNIQTRLPAALVSGRMDSDVGAMQAGTVTATVIATGAIDADAIAADAIGASELAADAVAEIADAVWDEDATGHQTGGTFGQAIGDPVLDTNTIFKATVTDATGATVGVDAAAILADTGTDGVVLAAGAITTTTFGAGAIDAAAIAANAIGASEIAADAIGASELAADAVDEILDDTIGDGTITVRQALRILVAGMSAKLSGAATTTITIRNVADTADVIVATVDADGNRSATTVTP